MIEAIIILVSLVQIQIDYDAKPRTFPIHPKLKKAIKENKEAKLAFDQLSPSRQKEILRYINSLNADESIDKNIQRTLGHLTNTNSFVGRKNL